MDNVAKSVKGASILPHTLRVIAAIFINNLIYVPTCNMYKVCDKSCINFLISQPPQ